MRYRLFLNDHVAVGRYFLQAVMQEAVIFLT
jgi:hypothetical protein